MRRELDLDEAVAHDLLLALDEAVLAWLSQKSSSVVLPPIDAPPRIPVLRETLLLGARSAVVRIVAYDQEGMISLSVAQEEPTLAQACRAASAPPWRDGKRSTSRRRRTTPIRRSGWTCCVEGSRSTCGCSRSPGRSATPSKTAITTTMPSALGSPTHGAGRVHVNTAPVSVIESIYHQSGRGGFEHVIAARAKGKPVTAVPPPAYGEDALPSLVTSSHGFAFGSTWRSVVASLLVGRLRGWWRARVVVLTTDPRAMRTPATLTKMSQRATRGDRHP